MDIRDDQPIALLSEYRDENAPYVFATNNPLLSMTYTVPKGVRLGNCHGVNGAELLFMEKESVIGDPELHGGMYCFESDQFTQVHSDDGPTDQWVSAAAVDLSDAGFVPVRSFNDIMRSGVQVFQIADLPDYDADAFSRDWDRIGPSDPDGSKFLSYVSELVLSGKLRWMNEERGIHPASCFGDDRTESYKTHSGDVTSPTLGLRP